jgi:anti-sigma factor RsiW
MAQEERQPLVQEITCQEIAQWTSAYLDDHVGDERKRQIAVHLAICAGCETYVKQIATVRDVVGALPKVAEQPSDSHRLRQAFVARARRSASDERDT